MLGPDWSRRLGRAFSVLHPDMEMQERLNAAFEQASDDSELPEFFLNFVREAERGRQTPSGLHDDAIEGRAD